MGSPELWWVVAAAAPVVMWTMSRRGVLLDPDSAAYLRHGELIRANLWGALITPEDPLLSAGRFPPTAPSVFAALGAGPLHTRPLAWLAVASFTTTTIIIGLFLRRNASPAATAIGCLVLLMSRGWALNVHGFAMSDGIAMTCSVVALDATERAMRVTGPVRRRWATFALLAAAGAAASRWNGVAIAVVVAVALAWRHRAEPRRAFLRAVFMLIAPLAPLMVWAAVQPPPNGSAGFGFGDRPIEWFDFRAADGEALLSAVGLMITPNMLWTGWWAAVPFALATTAVALALASASRWLWREARRTAWPETATPSTSAPPGDWATERSILLLSAVGMVATITITAARLLADPHILPSIRHIAVPWMAAVTATTIASDRWVRRADQLTPMKWSGESRWRRLVALTVAIVATSGAAPGFVRALASPSEAAFDLRTDIAASRLLERPEITDQRRLLATNRGDLVYLATGRVAAVIPPPRDPLHRITDAAQRKELDETLSRIRRCRGTLAWFGDDSAWAPPLALLRRAGFTVTWSDGSEALLAAGGAPPDATGDCDVGVDLTQDQGSAAAR